MAYSSVRTLNMAHLELCKSMKLPFVPLPNSTLNQEYNIQNGAVLPVGVTPEIGYIGIGRGGHRNVTGAGSEPLTDILQHKIVNACFMKPLPFIVRPITDDLPPAKRELYRLRRVETHGGVQYFVYYLRKITFTASQPEISVLTIDADGNVTPSAYISDATRLDPGPVSMVNGEVNLATNEHISVSVPVAITLNKTDCMEIVNACQIIYNDARFANITEIGIVSAVDKNVTSADGGINVTYTEALAAQVVNFIGADINLRTTSKEVKLDYRLSSTMPYLK